MSATTDGRKKTAGPNARERIIAAARELTLSNHGTTFTVQQLIEGAGVALRTFYRYFDSKDAVILALWAVTVSDTHRLAEEAASVTDDPVERLRVIVTKPLIEGNRGIGNEVIVKEHLRLMGEHPQEIEAGMRAYRQLIESAIEGAQQVGTFRFARPTDDSRFIQWMVMEEYFYRTLGLSKDSRKSAAERLWEFCLGALSRGPAEGYGTANAPNPGRGTRHSRVRSNLVGR